MLGIVSHNNPGYVPGERGGLLVEVGEVCKECKYCSRRTGVCDYRLMTGTSRLVTNNIRIDPKFCDKYVRGEKEYDRQSWFEGFFAQSSHRRAVLR